MLSLFTDGAARNNPGPAGAGWLIKDEGGKTLVTGNKSLGLATNNEAEYQALILGLGEASQLNSGEINCFLDSNLVVQQLNGHFRVKQAHLRELLLKVREIETQFDQVTYQHIYREGNREADALANEAIDKEGSKFKVTRTY